MLKAKEEQILKTFAVIIPKLSDSDKSYLLGLGEGMTLAVKKQENASEEVADGKRKDS